MIQIRRKLQIFRGEFQAGPFAAVFLLFLIFFLFNTSLVYIPGLPVDLNRLEPALRPHQTNTVTIDERAFLSFKGRTFREFGLFEKQLREEVRTNATLRLLSVKPHPAATNTVVQRVVNLARELDLLVDLPGGRINLPEAGSLVIATNPVITLAINMAGQIYFENQVVPENWLKEQLAEAVQARGQPVTLVVLADKTVAYDKIIRAGAAARAAGIQQVLLATRPSIFTRSPAP